MTYIVISQKNFGYDGLGEAEVRWCGTNETEMLSAYVDAKEEEEGKNLIKVWRRLQDGSCEPVRIRVSYSVVG